VYVDDDRVVRGLSAESASELRKIMEMAWYRRAVDGGAVVGSTWLDADPGLDGADWAAYLEHERIPFISYPYEWPFEMLRDAARLQIELLRVGLDDGVMSKDASPYNVQFVGSRPVFIDVGSFELQREGEPWYGYRQFCQLFLYPLMFQAYKDLPYHPWLRGSIDGIEPDQARRVLSGRKGGRKGVLTHVELHARAQNRFADTDQDVKKDLKQAGFQQSLIKANLDKLAKLLDHLDWDQSTSEWSNYSERAHYAAPELEHKAAFVREVAAARPRKLAWDVGCNDGFFSRLVAEHTDCVLALDADQLVVDQLYRALRSERDARILPLFMNLADPSPGIGWRGRERLPFAERSRPDLVLALAVIHHMSLTNNVPLPDVIDFFADVTPELVIEFPTPDDQMVKRLLRNKREGIHDDYTLERFEACLADRFDIRRREELEAGTRIMYHAVRRS
jgi:hypothetical protein